jgi:hypothetical protein
MFYSTFEYNEQDLAYIGILFARVSLCQQVKGRVELETHSGAKFWLYFDSVEPLQGIAMLYKAELSTLRIMDEGTDVAYKNVG